ncbi:MAG TPA: peptidoglycan DD-metalloendopeptidase family protein [Chitinivibrionales bacterium]
MHWKHERRSQIYGIALALCAVWCLTLSAAAKDGVVGAVDDYDKKIEEKHLALDSVKSELIKGREKLKRLQLEEGTRAQQLDQVEKNITVSHSYIRRLTLKIDSTSRSIEILESSLTAENVRLAFRREEMAKRLRSVYKTGQMDLPHILLASKTMSDLLHRVRYFEALHEYDRRLVSQIDSSRFSIRTRKESLEKVNEQLSLLKKEKEVEYAALLEEQAQRQSLLESVRSQKNTYAAMIKDLEAAQKELKEIVSMLEVKRKRARGAKEQGLLIGFEKRKGALPWPVDGDVVLDFGKVVHSIYKTVIMNTGIDIGSRKGGKVHCVASGKVAYVGWMRGFGKFAIVDHGGYYTTYAHLDQVTVEKDDDVKNGSLLGTVEDPGVVGTAKLHFEIRKSTEALDPLDWLEKRKR